MKRKITAVLFLASVMTLLLFTSSSCMTVEEEPIDEALKISMWCFRNDLGDGYFGYDPALWIDGDTGEVVYDDEAFEFVTLKVGEVRNLAPFNFHPPTAARYIPNLGMFIEFDGVIEVSVDEEGCEYIHLNMTASDEKAARIQEMYVNLCPLGIDEHYGLNISPDTALGYDYYLTVRTQNLLGKPMVTAHLKLSTLPDPYYPQEETYSEKYSRYPPDVVRTRLMSVELLSYEYSDVYLMENDMAEEEE